MPGQNDRQGALATDQLFTIQQIIAIIPGQSKIAFDSIGDCMEDAAVNPAAAADGDSLDVVGVSSADQCRLIDAWIDSHAWH